MPPFPAPQARPPSPSSIPTRTATTLLAGAILILTTTLVVATPPAYDIVFFDLPESLEPSPIPSPTVDLAALPGHPADPDQLTLAGVVYTPDPLEFGPGPYPTVLILHGSGGLWSNDDIANGPASQFEDWADVLCARGYLCLLPDSYNPRGIDANFGGKRPHHDPSKDDALCSPNYERPKDVIAALAYLAGRADVDAEHIGLLGFSHGSQTGLNAIVDSSVDISPYTVSYIDLVEEEEDEFVEQSVSLEVASPARIPDDLPFPKICAFYYPGGSHYGYHGQASSVAAGRYMPDRRSQVLMFHGTEDSLLGVSDTDADPLTGKLYPIKFVESSGLQAIVEGVPNPFVQHSIFDYAEHSFDNEDIEDEADWNTLAEDADEKAKRLARDETLKWFAFHLKPPEPTMRIDPIDSDQIEILWHGEAGLDYQIESSDDLLLWVDDGSPQAGADAGLAHTADRTSPPRKFFKVTPSPQPAPTAAPENTGFFRPYGDFSY